MKPVVCLDVVRNSCRRKIPCRKIRLRKEDSINKDIKVFGW
jgi:hypothetical protein